MLLEHFAAPPGKVSFLRNGYTYSHEDRPKKVGQKGPCCRPTKTKCTPTNKCVKTNCKRVNRCDKQIGKTRCGTECTKLINKLKRLQMFEQKRNAKEKKAEEKKAEKKKAEKKEAEEKEAEERKAQPMFRSRSVGRLRPRKAKPKIEEETTESFENYSEESESEYDSESDYSDEEESQEKKGDGGVEMGLRLKKGQKLSHKQLDILESASKKTERTSKNPLCKKKASIQRSRSHTEQKSIID